MSTGSAGVTAVVLLIVVNARGERPPDHRVLWLYNVHTREEIRLRPFGARGIPTRIAWARVNRFMRSWRTGERRSVSPRLLRALARVQERFGGRRIDVHSGYRAPGDGQALTSFHQVGRAIDLRIRGVPPRDVFEFCRRLVDVGAGLYPNGRHVHLDVRSRSAIWVDLSGYGDGARYVRSPAAWLARHPQAGR